MESSVGKSPRGNFGKKETNPNKNNRKKTVTRLSKKNTKKKLYKLKE